MVVLSIAYFGGFLCVVYFWNAEDWATAVFLRDDKERISFP